MANTRASLPGRRDPCRSRARNPKGAHRDREATDTAAGADCPGGLFPERLDAAQLGERSIRLGEQRLHAGVLLAAQQSGREGATGRDAGIRGTALPREAGNQLAAYCDVVEAPER